MIQRSLTRTSRAFGSGAQHSSSSFASLRQQTPSLRIPLAQLPSRPASRWYSEAAEANKEEPPATGERVPAEGEAKSAGPEDPRKKDLEAKNKEVVDLKDKYLRSVADFRNLQERTKREVASARDFAISRFAKDLIDSVDNLDRALATVPVDALTASDANKDLVSLHSGLKMTETILMNTLKKHGLERFDPAVEGEKFDPNKHEATFQTPQPDKEDGTVFYTQQKGFVLNGRVLRAAKVGVVKNS